MLSLLVCSYLCSFMTKGLPMCVVWTYTWLKSYNLVKIWNNHRLMIWNPWANDWVGQFYSYTQGPCVCKESVCFNTPHIFPLCLNILQMLAYVYDGALMLSSFMCLRRKLYCFIKSLVGWLVLMKLWGIKLKP